MLRLLHAQGSELAFFELAATLIPILIFGGVVAERRVPNDVPDSRVLGYALLIPAFGGIAILGELDAIHVLVRGSAQDFDRIIVAVVLTLALLAVVFFVWLPWLSAARSKVPNRYPFIVLVGILFLAFIGLSTGRNIVRDTQSQSDSELARHHVNIGVRRSRELFASLNENFREIQRDTQGQERQRTETSRIREKETRALANHERAQAAFLLTEYKALTKREISVANRIADLFEKETNIQQELNRVRKVYFETPYG